MYKSQVLKLAKGTNFGQMMRGTLLKTDREFAPGLFLLQAPNVKVALEESQRLAKSRNVLVSHPVRRRPMQKTAPMAKRPNDPLYDTQWPLENRDPATGDQIGPEFNIREAWAGSTGQGVVIGIAEDGVDLARNDFLGQGADLLLIYISEPTRLRRISYGAFCSKKTKTKTSFSAKKIQL